MHTSPPIDGFDLRLLAALQEDGRRTNQQIGDRIGLSASNAPAGGRRWRRRG